MQTTRLNPSRATLLAPTPRKLACACRGTPSKSMPLACLLCASALADEPRAPRAAPADRTLEELVVTGTRLSITAIEAIAPVTVLSRRDIERGGADSIGKVLQALPAVTGSQLNTNVNGQVLPQDGGGSSSYGSIRAALRGATLVLLNGRRFPNSGIGADSSVDLNTFPVSLIERVEVLSGGASAAAVGSRVRRRRDRLSVAGIQGQPIHECHRRRSERQTARVA